MRSNEFSSTQPNAKQTMTMTIKEILEIKAGLASLDTFTALNERNESVEVPFQFYGLTRWKIAKNLAVCEKVERDFAQERNRLFKAYADPGTGKLEQGSENFKTATAQLEDYANSEGPVILLLPRSDIVRDDQPVPAGVLACLMPIIEDDTLKSEQPPTS